MPSESAQYLSSDELRQLTLRGSGFSQIQRLEEMGIEFVLDPYGCPLVLYQDAKKYFVIRGIPLR
jgi:hypothetical protein